MTSLARNLEREFNPNITSPVFLIKQNLYRKIRQYAPNLNGRLMDFGCGQKPYEHLFKVSNYIGVDFKGEGETYSQEKVDVFYDGKTLPFEDNYFDAIFSSEVFEHVFNLPEILMELKRVLKPGGRILVTCPFAYGEHEIPNDYARYTSFAMKYMFESNGFKILVQDKTGGNIEAITQLRIVYWNLHIISRVRKIPVVRSLFRFLVFVPNNLFAIIAGKIFPYRQDLYLNNIVLAEKTAE
ncbi:class I SAM-dependent methyltransferase [Pollutibacter soli]|uniref:class I SAM-dependent methyltransferase n=1 Tax=Pollutibacter soli TaxID=3034157 RepID=UPI0030132113